MRKDEVVKLQFFFRAFRSFGGLTLH